MLVSVKDEPQLNTKEVYFSQQNQPRCCRTGSLPHDQSGPILLLSTLSSLLGLGSPLYSADGL